MIEDLSKHLAEIGHILGTKMETGGYNNFGAPMVKIEYEEDRIDKVKELINDINRILNSAE